MFAPIAAGLVLVDTDASTAGSPATMTFARAPVARQNTIFFCLLLACPW